MRVLALSGYEHAFFIAAMFEAGAAGYLIKDEAAAGIVRAVREVARGAHIWRTEQIAAIQNWCETVQRPWTTLTEREREVLLAVACGFGNREIARRLQVTERTVEFHVANGLDKLGACSRSAAVAWVKDNAVERWGI